MAKEFNGIGAAQVEQAFKEATGETIRVPRDSDTSKKARKRKANDAGDQMTGNSEVVCRSPLTLDQFRATWRPVC